jgi:hypothetical protein
MDSTISWDLERKRRTKSEPDGGMKAGVLSSKEV